MVSALSKCVCQGAVHGGARPLPGLCQNVPSSQKEIPFLYQCPIFSARLTLTHFVSTDFLLQTHHLRRLSHHVTLSTWLLVLTMDFEGPSTLHHPSLPLSFI